LNAAAAVSLVMFFRGTALRKADAESWITRIHRAPDAPRSVASMVSMLICSKTPAGAIGLSAPYFACRDVLAIWHDSHVLTISST
jgi:hypothetical protein